MLPGMNTDVLPSPCASTTTQAAKAALLSPERWRTSPLDTATLQVLLARCERGIRGTASAAARCLGERSGSALASALPRSPAFLRLTPTNSSQPLALLVISFIALVTPRASIARESACVGATALSIIFNGRVCHQWPRGLKPMGKTRWDGFTTRSIHLSCRQEAASPACGAGI